MKKDFNELVAASFNFKKVLEQFRTKLDIDDEDLDDLLSDVDSASNQQLSAFLTD